MANLTRKYVEQYIDEVNKSIKGEIRLDSNNGEYEVYFNNSRLFVGTIREAYILIQGLSYGLGAKSNIAAPPKMDDRVGVEVLKKKIAEKKPLFVEAKKTAVDECFSQGKLRYAINIESLRDNTVSFTAEVKHYSDDDIPSNSGYSIPIMTVKIDKLESIDKVAKRMLKGIDIQMQKIAEREPKFNPDYILWIDKDVMWFLFWNNAKIITKSVSINVVN